MNDQCHKHHNSHSHHNNHQHHTADYKKRFWITLILTIPVLLFSSMTGELFSFAKQLQFPGVNWFLLSLCTLIFFYGGWPFLKGLKEELHRKQPGMMTLIGIAISTAYVYSSLVVFGLPGMEVFWELATLIDIMLLGHWVEMRSVMGAGQALEKLASLLPQVAHKIVQGGDVQDIILDQIKKGDHVMVKPGERIPGDGIVVSGQTTVNEAMLTGESIPILKHIGDKVLGGSVNGEGSLVIEIQMTGEDGFIARIIKLVKEAQENKSQTEEIAQYAARWLTFIAIGGGILTLIWWTVFTINGFAFALERMVAVMVITCPHALGLAVPLVVAVSTSLAASHGLLLRKRSAFEHARKIQAVVFDKTGTLTKGDFGVTDIVWFDSQYTENRLLLLAGSIEQHSEHPIAKAIAKASSKLLEVSDFKAIPGKGAEGLVNGQRVKVVSPSYLEEQHINIPQKKINHLMHSSKTVVFVLVNDVLAGAIALADVIREESKNAVRELKAMGIRCLMLTGDAAQVAKWVSDEIGLDEYYAGIQPHQKASKIKEIQKRGFIVAMAGDGINDAPALAQADIGIAIGAGTDVAIETADIILVKNNPLDVVSLIKLARASYRKMIENLIWATGYNVFAIPAAAGVLYAWDIVLSPALGAVFMSLSTVVCAVNARLLKIK
jgi:Cu2+-exporting ATPase